MGGDRWCVYGAQTIAVHTADLGDLARRWRAIWEIGMPSAALDGVSALAAAGLVDVESPVVHLSVPRDFRRHHVAGVRLHRVSRVDGEVIRAGLPRVRPAVAALRAASWARSDRQAALFLVMPTQQRIVHPKHLADALSVVGLRERRGLVARLVDDVVDGAHSLGELDFAALCRRHGLPKPDRQVLRRSPQGRTYVDVRWADVGLVVEIDGSGHRMGLAVTDDNLRQNAVVIDGDCVLRMNLMGLRLAEDDFMAQVKEAYARLLARAAA